MTENFIDPATTKVGDKVVLAGRYGIPPGLPSGATYGTVFTVTRVEPRHSGGITVRVADESGQEVGSGVGCDYGYEFFAPAPEAETPAETPQPGRPKIDFSASRYATARDYAADLDSRVLDAKNRVTLQAVADGKEVDAYDVNDAVLHAMSSVSTRFSQSALRRQYTKRARHLHYIVQAVIENHADGLPAYETGERSRRIETLEGQVAALKTAGEDALREIEKQTAELERLRQQLRLQQNRTAEQESNAARWARVARYAQRLLREEVDAPRYADAVDGYADAVFEITS